MCAESLDQVPVGCRVAVRSPGGRAEVAQLPQQTSQSARRGPQGRHFRAGRARSQQPRAPSPAGLAGRPAPLHSAVYRRSRGERRGEPGSWKKSSGSTEAPGPPDCVTSDFHWRTAAEYGDNVAGGRQRGFDVGHAKKM